MNLVSLPDDVLLLIFSYLRGRDALNVAITSKRLYPLALPRIAAMIMCWTPIALRRLHRYMLSGPQLRAKYLRSLSIDVFAVCKDEQTDYLEPDTDERYAVDVSQVQLLGDLLLRAPNLTELSLEGFHWCLCQDPRIGPALQSMGQLANLRLSTLGDSALYVLRECKANIHRLTLSYYLEGDYSLGGEPKTLTALFSAISPFRNLRILKLWNFTPYGASLSPTELRRSRLSRP
ncbi:hypothetical protein NUW54_g8527 [Trametes sanguinea]|uniref:Uncharacterized protein n=1 Tax=Trametes sanguinea TaxID=158606 RepID=A0ACC1PCQ8_9APHY|nr:hypothetical protein NUW54_g8527 [Trametes sanguinea]